MTVSRHDLPEEFPCPVCGELREIGISKKNKPYFQCTPCGVQVFIRGKLGINRFSEIKNNSELTEKIKSLAIFDSCKLLQIKQRIIFVQEELEKINSDGLFSRISKAEEAKKAKLISKLESLETEYCGLLLSGEKPLSKNESQV